MVDREVAHAFGQPWRLINYWHLMGAHLPIPLILVLLLIALPFIWFGVSMTLLRLRDASLPGALVTLFFVPVLNLLFFVWLCLIPSRAGRSGEKPAPARDSTGAASSAVYSVLLTTAFAVPCAGITTWLFRDYGVMLFVGLPFCIGFLSAIVHGYRYPRSGLQIFIVATLALLFTAGALLAVAWEGIVCLLMALPIALPLTFLGAAFGYVVQRASSSAPGRAAALCIPMALPLLMSGEAAHSPPAPVYVVRTSLDIDAPPDRVWRNVIHFPDITEEPEWIFRAGVAYPLRARIAGTGAGATRYCIFTTGAFVEPIEIWDAPRRLRFGVSRNPAPMNELSPYASVRPPHVDGFLVSRRGEFVLEPLPDGRTRLTGTTWYQHHLAPAPYWRLWSDAIIHRIHLRVLRHVRRLSEHRGQRAPDMSAPDVGQDLPSERF